jgi:HEAT repeat protein
MKSRKFIFRASFALVLGLASIVSSLSAADAQAFEVSADAALNRMLKVLKFGGFNPAGGEPTKMDAALALGLLGDARAVPTMIEHLENETDNQLKLALVRSLGWIGTPEVVPGLEKALTDKYPYVRKQSAVALKKITGKDYEFDQTGLPSPASLEELRARMEKRKAAASSTPEK